MIKIFKFIHKVPFINHRRQLEKGVCKILQTQKKKKKN